MIIESPGSAATGNRAVTRDVPELVRERADRTAHSERFVMDNVIVSSPFSNPFR
jgi:hypothetical protein